MTNRIEDRRLKRFLHKELVISSCPALLECEVPRFGGCIGVSAGGIGGFVAVVIRQSCVLEDVSNTERSHLGGLDGE
jgi:hypothetical protein